MIVIVHTNNQRTGVTLQPAPPFLNDTTVPASNAGQAAPDIDPASPSPVAATLPPAGSIIRQEQLARAIKAFIFTVIIHNGRAVCTIHYPGVFQVTGYSDAEYAAQPLLWFSMILPEDRPLILRQITQLLRGETPSPTKHRIKHKDGSIRWLKNTSIPVFNPQGTLIAYDGMIADISSTEFAGVKQEHQIAELTSALTRVQTTQRLLPICCSCKKIRDDQGYWQRIEPYLEQHYPDMAFTHGLCPDCARQLYPQYFVDTPETILVNQLVDGIQEVTGALSDNAVEAVCTTNHQSLITATERRKASP